MSISCDVGPEGAGGKPAGFGPGPRPPRPAPNGLGPGRLAPPNIINAGTGPVALAGVTTTIWMSTGSPVMPAWPAASAWPTWPTRRLAMTGYSPTLVVTVSATSHVTV